MNKLRVMPILLMIMSLLVVSCASAAPKEFTSPKQTIEVQVGEQFIIILDSNPTTGYSWEADFDESFLKLAKSEYEPSDKPEGMVGTGGKERFVFEGLNKGDTQVRLTYKRPWEQEVADTKTFSVSIK